MDPVGASQQIRKASQIGVGEVLKTRAVVIIIVVALRQMLQKFTVFTE